MRKLTIEIDMDGKAFRRNSKGEGFEVARILRELAKKCEFDDTVNDKLVFDVNGYIVGDYIITLNDK